MLALSLEWFNCGELYLPGNDHWYGGHLNLAGMSATGLFYLAMRKGLDYLERHPHVDRDRLGVTGLSGGAWQTGVLSGLDERVAAAAPVSGYFAFLSAIERNADVGDMEYNPPDLGIDYTHLTALRAPRPTLLMFSAEDNYYVGRAALTKPYLYDQIRPFFRLFGKEEAFEWHENTDPGTHTTSWTIANSPIAFSAVTSDCPCRPGDPGGGRGQDRPGAEAGNPRGQSPASWLWRASWPERSNTSLHPATWRGGEPGSDARDNGSRKWCVIALGASNTPGAWPIPRRGDSRVFPTVSNSTTISAPRQSG